MHRFFLQSRRQLYYKSQKARTEHKTEAKTEDICIDENYNNIGISLTFRPDIFLFRQFHSSTCKICTSGPNFN